MPQYQPTPFKEPVKLLVSGQLSYLFGSYNDRVSPTLGYIIQDLAIGLVGEVVFQIVSGNPPIVGSLITVRGAGRSPNFNVTNAVVTAVVTNMDTGVCTVAYAIVSTVLPIAADHGEVAVPQPEIGETLANVASIPVAMPFQNAQMGQGKDLVVIVAFPIVPTTAVVTLQSALIDLDSEYADVATVVSVSGSVVTGGQLSISDMAARFYRLKVTGVTGVGTIVGKING